MSDSRDRSISALVVLCSLMATLCVGCGGPPSIRWSPSEVQGYDVARVNGFAVYTPRDWRESHQRLTATAARTLRADLRHVTAVVPSSAIDTLRDVPIWLEPENTVSVDGFSGRGMVFHPSAEWLGDHGLMPAKANAIEICNVRDYLEWRAHQPMMVLHELAHAYHFRVLGYDHPAVVDAYEKARASGRYDRVNYVLSENEDDLRPAYAMNNPMEYFAELTEAYFGVNDYFPFNRRNLYEFDPVGYEMIERAWNAADR